MAACEVRDRLPSRPPPIYGQFTKLLGQNVVVGGGDHSIIWYLTNIRNNRELPSFGWQPGEELIYWSSDQFFMCLG